MRAIETVYHQLTGSCVGRDDADGNTLPDGGDDGGVAMASKHLTKFAPAAALRVVGSSSHTF